MPSPKTRATRAVKGDEIEVRSRQVATVAQNALMKAATDYLMAQGVNAKALASKANRFSRISQQNLTPWGTYQKVLSQYGKFYDYGGLSYKSLRTISQRALLVEAIHAVRALQIRRVSRPIRDPKKDMGFRIIPDGFYEKGFEISDQQKARAKEIEKQILTPHPVHEPTFSDYCKRFMEEHLTINRVAIELIKEGGKLKAFGLIDGALVQPTYITVKKFIEDDSKTNNVYRTLNDWGKWNLARDKMSQNFKLDIANSDYVYFVDGVPQAIFTSDELMIVHEDVPVDINLFGFPPSKVEKALQGIVSFINMWSYNDRAFTGTMVDVILGITGENVSPDADTFTVIEEQLQGFQGVGNAFRVPLIELYDKADMKAIQLGRGNRDMQFDKLLQASVALVTSVYRMNPGEINFKGFSGEGQALYEASQDEAMNLAKEEGFNAELMLFEETMTKIVKMIDPDYSFEWFGFNREDREKKAKVEQIEVQTKKSINEIRDEDGEPLYDEEYCREHNIDPEILPYLNLPMAQGLQIAYGQIQMRKQQKEDQENQAKEQEEQGGEEGKEPEEGSNFEDMGLPPGGEGTEGAEGGAAMENPLAAVQKSNIWNEMGFGKEEKLEK